jgi:hypothetical protein
MPWFTLGTAHRPRPAEYVTGYCELLAAAGIEPLYRESEPMM